MILAAGRGERMQPLTDHTPKPLLAAGGKPLIQWNIERLAAAGFTDIVINHAHLGSMIEFALGDGDRFGVRIRYSREVSALETAGGIAYALPLLGNIPFLAVSADIYSEYDFSRLRQVIERMNTPDSSVLAHLVMTPNPDHHPRGDFVLADGLLRLDGGPRLNFGNIGVYHPRLFAGVQRGAKARLGDLFQEAIARGQVTGEYYDGRWVNVGTPEQLAALDALLTKRLARKGSDIARAVTVAGPWPEGLRAQWLALMELAVWGELKATRLGGAGKLRKKLLELGERLVSLAADRAWIPRPREQLKNALASALNVKDALLQLEQSAQGVEGGADRPAFEAALIRFHRDLLAGLAERENHWATLLDALAEEDDADDDHD